MWTFIEAWLQYFSMFEGPLEFLLSPVNYQLFIGTCFVLTGLFALVSRRHVPSVALGFSILPCLAWSPVAVNLAVHYLQHPELLEAGRRLPPLAILAAASISATTSILAAIALLRRQPLKWPIVTLYAVALVHALHMFISIEAMRDPPRQAFEHEPNIGFLSDLVPDEANEDAQRIGADVG